MSRCVNSITLIGNVGNEPEMRATATGLRVAKFSLATSWKYRDTERTDWHRITCFGKTVDFVERFIHKGDRLYVRGRVEYNTTEDADGNKKFWTDVVADDVISLADRGHKGSTDEEVEQEIPF